MQHLNLSSKDQHIQQELKHILEKYGKAIVVQGEKSKYFIEMVERVIEISEVSARETKQLDEHVKRLAEELRNKEINIQQLQATISVQETELSRLQMDLSRSERTSYDGILLVEIKDYSRKKTEAQNGTTSFYTDAFYTDKYGYKMCARIYLNGDGVGKGTHLSIFFAIKKGPYDSYLKWPFQRRVTFTLLNQEGKEDISDSFRPDTTSSSFQKPRRDMNIASGCPMFASHSVLENPREGFLRSNTICLKVIVDPPPSRWNGHLLISLAVVVVMVSYLAGLKSWSVIETFYR